MVLDRCPRRDGAHLSTQDCRWSRCTHRPPAFPGQNTSSHRLPSPVKALLRCQAAPATTAASSHGHRLDERCRDDADQICLDQERSCLQSAPLRPTVMCRCATASGTPRCCMAVTAGASSDNLLHSNILLAQHDQHCCRRAAHLHGLGGQASRPSAPLRGHSLQP